MSLPQAKPPEWLVAKHGQEWRFGGSGNPYLLADRWRHERPGCGVRNCLTEVTWEEIDRQISRQNEVLAVLTERVARNGDRFAAMGLPAF